MRGKWYESRFVSFFYVRAPPSLSETGKQSESERKKRMKARCLSYKIKITRSFVYTIVLEEVPV